MTPLKTLITLAALLAAQAAFAQNQPSPSDNTCNASVIPDMVHGDYTITAGPLVVRVGTAAMFPDPETTDTGNIYPGPLREFMVNMTPPIPDFELVETDRMQPDWYWDALPTGSRMAGLYLSSKDLELVTNCTIREMPRFIGTFQTMSQEGIPLEHTIRLVMALPDWLIGSWRWRSITPNGPIDGTRFVIFDRTNPHVGN